MARQQTHVQFNLRCCPALQDKAKAKSEALAAVRKDTSPEAKRQKRDDQTDRSDDSGDKQNTQEPFKPPYVPELFLGCLNGLEDEPGMSILVCFVLACTSDRVLTIAQQGMSDPNQNPTC